MKNKCVRALMLGMSVSLAANGAAPLLVHAEDSAYESMEETENSDEGQEEGDEMAEVQEDGAQEGTEFLLGLADTYAIIASDENAVKLKSASDQVIAAGEYTDVESAWEKLISKLEYDELLDEAAKCMASMDDQSLFGLVQDYVLDNLPKYAEGESLSDAQGQVLSAEKKEDIWKIYENTKNSFANSQDPKLDEDLDVMVAMEATEPMEAASANAEAANYEQDSFENDDLDQEMMGQESDASAETAYDEEDYEVLTARDSAVTQLNQYNMEGMSSAAKKAVSDVIVKACMEIQEAKTVESVNSLYEKALNDIRETRDIVSLTERKEVNLSGLRSTISSLPAESAEQKTRLQAIQDEYSSRIQDAETEEEANRALDEGCQKAKEVSSETEGVLEQMKKENMSGIDKNYNQINQVNDIVNQLVLTMKSYLNQGETTEQITDSYVSALQELSYLKALYDLQTMDGKPVTESPGYYTEKAIQNLKYFTDSQEAKDLLDALAADEKEPNRMELAVAAVDFKGLDSFKERIADLLKKEASKHPSEETESILADVFAASTDYLSAYKAYKAAVEALTDASTGPDMEAGTDTDQKPADTLEAEQPEALKEAVEKAEKEIQELLAQIEDANTKASAEEMSKTVLDTIHKSVSETEISTVVTAFKDQVSALAENPELAAMRSEMIQKFTTETQGLLSTQKAAHLYYDAQIKMAKAETTEALQSIYQDALDQIRAENVNYLRTRYAADMDKILEDLNIKNNRNAADMVASAKEKLSGMETEKDMLDLYTSTRKQVLELLEGKEADDKDALTSYKEDALKKLATTSESENAKKIIASYESLIRTADSEEKVDAYLEKALSLLASIKKQEDERSEALTAAKDSAAGEVNQILEAITDTSIKDQAAVLAGSALQTIRAADSEAVIRSTVQAFKSQVDNLQKSKGQEESLKNERAEMLQKLTDAVSSRLNTEKAVSIFNEAKTRMASAVSYTELQSIYSDTVKKIGEEETASLREIYNTRLDSMLENASEDNQSQVAAIVASAKHQISAVNDEATMKAIVSSAETKVAELSKTKADLTAAKEAAIKELEGATTLSTSSAQKVITTYTNRINTATTQEQIDAYLAEGKRLLSTLNQAAGLNADGTTPASSDAGSDTASPNSATSTTTDDTQKDEDVATLNKNTAEDAKAKGDNTATTPVRTGDENGPLIAGSILAIFGSLVTAVYAFLRRRIQK